MIRFAFHPLSSTRNPSPSMRRALVIAACFLAKPASAQYAVSHTYQLGAEGAWDYVIPDPARHRLFIARQNRVMVVDERTGKLLGELTGIHGAHGVALVDRTGRGYATSSDDSSDRKSTRLNSSHLVISYAVFCLKKKKKENRIDHRC